MYDELTDKIGRACPDWELTVKDDGKYHCVLFERWSPAGEDIPLEHQFDKHRFPSVSIGLIADWLQEEYEQFDVDEHVELWIGSRGKNGAPATVRELLEDAEAIEKMLEELAIKVRSVA
jgi:hypothetical protein